MSNPESDKQPRPTGTDDADNAEAVADLDAPEEDDVKGAKKAAGRWQGRARTDG